ncbi:MAG: hypothetical protein Q7K03_10005 [Dehalococcoidia bacterium]|nr:hypothetical protein [Dehalococcoidia bacterium]
MDPIQIFLGQLSISVSQSICDVVKSYLSGNNASSLDELSQSLRDADPSISLDSASVIARKVVDLLAQNGQITISGAQIRQNHDGSGGILNEVEELFSPIKQTHHKRRESKHAPPILRPRQGGTQNGIMGMR